jgi:FecR protein
LNTCKRTVAAVLCLLLSPLPAVCQSASGDHAGQINALVPDATRNAKPAKAKDDLNWNDLLQTQKSGRLRAGLKDGSILSLGSNSELRVVQHDAATQQTSLEVDFGKVRSKVVKITQPNGKFEIKTPNAVIGVVGTDFFVGYEADRTTVICYRGKVMVTPSGNAKIVKNSGQADGSNSIAVAEGQMVIISSEIPAGGFQSSAAPKDLLQVSMNDTTVPDGPVASVHPHLVRNLIIGLGVAATGWAVGYTQLNSSGGAAVPRLPNNCQTNPNPKLCG